MEVAAIDGRAQRVEVVLLGLVHPSMCVWWRPRVMHELVGGFEQKNASPGGKRLQQRRSAQSVQPRVPLSIYARTHTP